MTTIASRTQLRSRTLTRSQMEHEIAELAAEFGALEELQNKADRDLLTPDERVAMRRLDGLTFLLSRQR